MLSVVIPALNEEALLPFCLQAVRQQAPGKPFEVIKQLRDKGYRFVTVPILLNLAAYHSSVDGSLAGIP